MKKALWTILNVVSFAAAFVGFYMMISNFGRDNTMALWFGILFAVGILGILLSAFLLVKARNNNQK